MSDVVVAGALRTAIGGFGKGLKDVAPCELGSTVLKALLQQTAVAPEQIGHVVFGHVVNTEPRDMYLSRVASVNAGIPHTVPAFNVNRLCGSGLQAILSAAQAIKLGDTRVAIGAGAESMSRAPYIAVG
ncbi:MAG TPA: acetyl-CoA C-acyltransferase, partial [Burkholderiaceae bacterium]|nr:acetyl-CoA C-acyltransferase [Burkholderiaceae bacterium]